jgi:hypothetical protein
VPRRTQAHSRVLTTLAAAASLAAGCSGSAKLTGSIQKVRTYTADEQTAVLVADFRVANPSKYPWMVREVEVEVETADGKFVKGYVAADADAARFLDVHAEQGPKFNPSFAVRDRIAPGEEADRMVAASFEVAEPVLASRKSLRIRVHDADGPVVEFAQSP